MLEPSLFLLMLIGILGIGSQWVAWRFNLPAIVVMSVTGLLAGPIFRVMNPEVQFGDLYKPLISIAVAIILFEGSLKLVFREIKDVGHSIFRIVTIGALLAWVLGSFAAHFVAGLSWAVSFVIGGLLIVTGPTVILPLLRQSKLKPRPAAVLKWEGIIVDPLGALLAVFSYEIIRFFVLEKVTVNQLVLFFLVSLFAVLLGWLLGKLIALMFDKGQIPEFLKSPIVFGVVVFCFTIPNEIMHETGLLSVTAMGITLANLRVSSINDIRHFKENISVMLVSAIFIMLTASLSLETIYTMFNLRILAFVGLMLFVVRPLSIWLSTIRTDLTTKEKLLVSWIAPRGIVALTVSGYFSSILFSEGFLDASILVPLTFALVFSTVVIHGFSLRWLAKKLGLAAEGKPGVLIVGSNPFTVELAKKITKLDIPVIVTDSSWLKLQFAKQRGFKKTYYGELLAEKTEHRLDLTPYEYLIAATELDSYNALVCTNYIPEMGRNNVYQLALHTSENDDHNDYVHTSRGLILFKEGITWETLNKKIEEGYGFQSVQLTDEYDFEEFKIDLNEESIPLLILKKSGNLLFFTIDNEPQGESGDTVLSLIPVTNMDPDNNKTINRDFTDTVKNSEAEVIEYEKMVNKPTTARR
ncbi:cation:proton antiporter [Pseudalkalibacillus caeni]|uniref:Sodium:proton antiporter n=1 Tax=Exobacillus caeni TaxID=2574798 RepID=A0A5R9F185_9BACL|nr:sodium:proton antiporter [Pseudalkalibacillus caeni]TLS36196.1 sodium:proton antiporter [Pseudalkalibacillus caeni]